MNTQSRRDFVKLASTTALGGLAVLSRPEELFAHNAGTASKGAVPIHQSFYVEPGLVGTLDDSLQVRDIQVLSYPPQFSSIADSLAAPLKLDIASAETWASTRADQEGFKIASPSDIQSSADLLAIPLSGGLNLTDLSGSALSSLLDTRKLDLTLDFRYPATSADYLKVSANQPYIVPDAISVTLSGWRLQLRGPETHSLGSCVSSQVKHFNFEIFRETTPGRFVYVKNFHLGTYRSGTSRCFVLWNNISPGIICWKKCGPSSSDLASMYSWSLVAAASAVGVALSAALAATIANAGAVASYAALLALIAI